MKIYNKLVRDKIPEIIHADGKQAKTRILDEKEYLNELIKKLREEVAEFEENLSIEELADIKEVTIALCEAMNIQADKLEEIRLQKAKTNGRFKNRIFLETVSD